MDILPCIMSGLSISVGPWRYNIKIHYPNDVVNVYTAVAEFDYDSVPFLERKGIDVKDIALCGTTMEVALNKVCLVIHQRKHQYLKEPKFTR